jgi:hypothetical protein
MGARKPRRERGKAEGKIALDEIGGQQASAFAWLSIRQHASKFPEKTVPKPEPPFVVPNSMTPTL